MLGQINYRRVLSHGKISEQYSDKKKVYHLVRLSLNLEALGRTV